MYLSKDYITWFKKRCKADKIKIIKNLIKQGKGWDNDEKLNWSHQLISLLLNYKEKIMYAVYSAEKVLYIWKEKHPQDKHLQTIIDAAKCCIDNPNDKNKALALDAFFSIRYSAETAAALYAAEVAAEIDIPYATDTGAKKQVLIEILNYGLTLLEENNNNPNS